MSHVTVTRAYICIGDVLVPAEDWGVVTLLIGGWSRCSVFLALLLGLPYYVHHFWGSLATTDYILLLLLLLLPIYRGRAGNSG